VLRAGKQSVPGQAAVTPLQQGSGTDALSDMDTQLMLQARQGDRQAADTLIRRNSPRISRYLARLIGNSRPIEDLTQDVFLRAFKHAEQYQPSSRVTTWLYRIATNTALNYIKQATLKRTVPEPAESQLEVVDRSEPPPDRRLSLDELRQQVASAVSALPVNQRVALTLFEYEDCSYEQIAAILDVTVEAVRCLLMRARTQLRARLQGLL
jgi:RNA polymerase sigma-70 factor (ECF subfamily)